MNVHTTLSFPSHVTSGEGDEALEESGIGVLDDALAAELLNGAVALDGDETILNVQLTQSAAVVSDGTHTLICDQFAALDAQLLQIGAMFGQKAKSTVCNVTFTQIKSTKPRTATR